MNIIYKGLLLACLTSGLAFAQEEDFSAIKAAIIKMKPNTEVKTIKPSPISGLYEVKANGFAAIYMSLDGKYLLTGDIYELQDGRPVEVRSKELEGKRKTAFDALKANDMVAFPAVSKVKSLVYVFTDIDCGYCRKLHQEISEINQKGIEVRYLAFPRGGMSSQGASKLQSVWCAKDKRGMMTKAKSGSELAPAPASCQSPVEAQFNLGDELGVDGTPAIFTADGKQIGGYLSPKDMAIALGLEKAAE